MMKHNILLTPGPIPVPEAVRQVMAEPIIHHRTPQYRKIFERASERIKQVYLTKNPVYTFTGSGTSAMEASIVNFHQSGDEILVIDGGKFGERWTDLANAFGLKANVIKIPYGQGIEPKKIEEALTANPKIKSVCIELCETSTGVLYDIKGIGEVVAKTEALLIVDAISGLGADRMETDLWHVDLGVAGSQKAMMLPPGLAFLSVSPKASVRMKTANLPRFYLDVRLAEKALKDWDTPFTPALTIVIGLDKALDLILAEGMDKVFARAWELGKYTREKLQAMGLEVFSKAPSATCSAVRVPEGVDGEKLVKIMRDDKGVTMAGGQGEVKGKIVRIAHMGSITRQDIDDGLAVLKETIEELSAAALKK